jgi:hypothetical protein
MAKYICLDLAPPQRIVVLPALQMRTSAVERICNLPKLALTLSLQN